MVRSMKMKIDLKSVILGLIAGVLVTATLGAAAKTDGPVGRYQIAGAEEHGFVIDTATGRVWLGHFPRGVGNTDQDFLGPKMKN
jgi:hypothetical protein